ncbi:hypothetical protein [Streptomyces sp. NPDC051211]|uniref:hypothetical protein n=1 Tax=Streptomyces sp. NPDC051211 TaxID=3154643 RepID=UPI00344E7399
MTVEHRGQTFRISSMAIRLTVIHEDPYLDQHCLGLHPDDEVLTVLVHADAPCTVTNTATVMDASGALRDSASDPTPITGGECGDVGGDGNGGSILPVNLSGILPMFNNITTNNNINSPGASNVSSQTLRVNAP